jgi:hypothetical protein
MAAIRRTGRGEPMPKWLTGEWFIERTSAKRRRVLHYWATIVWLTVGLVAWVILRDALWFVGFMSLYAIWVTHIAGWAAETPVEAEVADAELGAAEAVGAAPGLVEAEPS